MSISREDVACRLNFMGGCGRVWVGVTFFWLGVGSCGWLWMGMDGSGWVWVGVTFFG